MDTNNNLPKKDASYIDIIELWDVVWSKKWVIMVVFVVSAMGSIYYSLRLPNIYKSETLLAPTEQNTASSLGGLSALAGLAGVKMGSGKISIIDKMNTLKNDTTFTEKILLKYKLAPYFIEGYSELLENEKEKSHFFVIRTLKSLVNISMNNKTSLISIRVEHPEPEFAYKLVNIYLEELSEAIRRQELKNINEKIEYYNQEISLATEASLKEELSKLASSLIQNKVLAKANKYYGVEQITKPTIADFRDKIGPKRSIIVITTCLVSTILSLFTILFFHLIKNNQLLDKKIR